ACASLLTRIGTAHGGLHLGSRLVHRGGFGVCGVHKLQQLLVMALVLATDIVDQLFDLWILALLSVMVAFFEGQKLPRHFILDIVEIFGTQLHPLFVLSPRCWFLTIFKLRLEIM